MTLLMIILFIMTMVYPVWVLADLSKSIRASKRARELESPKESYDERGYRAELDYHYIRAREQETGLSVSELTTCPDKDCRICADTNKELNVGESQVKVPQPDMSELNRILAEKDRIIAEAKRKELELERQLKEEAKYLVDHPIRNFRKSPVPAHATPEFKGRNADPVEVHWRWGNHEYVQVIDGYYIHDEEAGILRRCRNNSHTYRTGRPGKKYLKDPSYYVKGYK